MKPPPITADQISAAWIADAQDALSRGNYRVLGPSNEPVILIYGAKLKPTRMMLPGSGVYFSDTDERDAVLAKLQST